MSRSSDQKSILITGAGGFLGGELIRQIDGLKKYQLFAITSRKHIIASRFPDVEINYFASTDFLNGRAKLKDIDFIIHCGFSRAPNGRQLVESIEFSDELIRQSIAGNVKAIINISTEALYSYAPKPWIETDKCSPELLYGMAKYCVELLMRHAREQSGYQLITTNLRMSGLTGFGMDSRKLNHAVKITSTFIDNVINNKPTRIIGGKQMFGYMDVRDAAGGIIALLNVKPEKWKQTYNLGSKIRKTILEVAQIVNMVAAQVIKQTVNIDVEEKDINMVKIMDSTLFYNDTNWQPKYDMEAIVENILRKTL